ncbi:ABC transporter permease [Actimicrobium antarcticum]|uniref:ABC transporter permease n=1 Tax=Actimicrobium antarcticum TaxID=1051899 RepID=A0ABP7TYM0_9BURK
MLHLYAIALKSAWNRRLTLSLTLVAIALSVMMLVGVERIRNDARTGFAQSVSGTDLVIGARTSPVQLMLYSVFRIGAATNNIGWRSFQGIAAHPAVAWAIPLSLGDSHHGFPVLGTSSAYFEHFRYGASRPLSFVEGKQFESVFDVVLGAEIAQRLRYRLGDKITLNHGSNDNGLSEHADKPFTVVGILSRTGTPIDRTAHISLEAMEAIHLDWQGGAQLPGLSIPADHVRKFDLTPKQITAALVGLKSRAGVFKMQRFINESTEEPLLAVLPGVALDQLWQVVGIVEKTLFAVSALVVLVGLSGLVAVILAGLAERRRELAILRSVGARPRDVFLMLMLESLVMTVIGTLLGVALLDLATMLGAPLVQAHYGLMIQPILLAANELPLLGAVIGTGLLVSLVPGYCAYRLSLADGLTPRL